MNNNKTDYTLSIEDVTKIQEFISKLPRYKKIKSSDFIMFSTNSGIGVSVRYRREYTNGKKHELDLTDYGSW